MVTLIEVDGSESSRQALRYALAAAAQGSEPWLVLLYVSPSGRAGDLERGRFFLEDSLKACQAIAKDVRVRTRLEVGDPCEKLPAVAEAEGADLVVLGSHGVDCFPRLAQLGPLTQRRIHRLRRPVVVVVAPDGQPVKLPPGETPPGEDPHALRVRPGG